MEPRLVCPPPRVDAMSVSAVLGSALPSSLQATVQNRIGHSDGKSHLQIERPVNDTGSDGTP